MAREACKNAYDAVMEQASDLLHDVPQVWKQYNGDVISFYSTTVRGRQLHTHPDPSPTPSPQGYLQACC